MAFDNSRFDKGANAGNINPLSSDAQQSSPSVSQGAQGAQERALSDFAGQNASQAANASDAGQAGASGAFSQQTQTQRIPQVPHVDSAQAVGVQQGFNGTSSADKNNASSPSSAHANPAQSTPNAGGMSGGRAKGRGSKVVALIAGALLAGALGGGAVLAGMWSAGKLSIAGTTTQNNVNITTTQEEAGVAQAVAKKASPSVVSIYVTGADGDGVGSGVILDTDGNILTNYHVIANAQSISVTLSDGTSLEAEVVGSDQSSDLAVVKAKLNGTTVTPIEVADSDKLSVGDWVMSIGSPYGLDQSVSTGIVSSLYRSTMLPSTSGNTIYANLIQTDAAINPGNSGGALVNDKGELVGINSLIESESGSNSGIGFAIPANNALKVAKTILSGQKVYHPYIGLSVQTVTADNARIAGLAVNQGAYVANVADGGPAAQAGLQKGDVVTKVDDQDISSADGLILAIRQHEIGDKVKVTVSRDGKEQTFEVTLTSDEALQQEQESQQNQSPSNPFGGLQGTPGSDSSNSNSGSNSGSDSGLNSNSILNDLFGQGTYNQENAAQGTVTTTDGTQVTVSATTQSVTSNQIWTL